MYKYEFFGKLSRIINTGKSRSVILSGNVHDLFYDDEKFVPLTDFLSKKGTIPETTISRGVTVVLYEINRAVRVVGDDKDIVQAWNSYKGINPLVKDDEQKSFQRLIRDSRESPTLAIEFLRQMTICSRKANFKGQLLIVIEGTEMIVPMGTFSQMNLADRKRVAILHDWFSDPEFMEGSDSVVLLSESRSQIHSMVSTLPQVLTVDVPIPNAAERRLFAEWFLKKNTNALASAEVIEPPFVEMTAGLSLHAYRQLLCDYKNITIQTVIEKVEEFICSQLGDDVVEFKRPSHTLKDAVGFSRIKEFIRVEMMPRFKTNDPEEALPGAAVAGPIGGGKTFLFEAMASELEMPVLVLKNLRSQWFGQTDVIFERLKRTLEALGRVVIFVDEADTQFGGVGEGTHETERRLTAGIQKMMSDPKLLGKVYWLLMTARIEALSSDIRRPRRVGDLIIPVLDPEGQDRIDFIRWCFNVIEQPLDEEMMKLVDKTTIGYSAAAFTALRSQIKSRKCHSFEEAMEVASDMIPSDIGDARRYQILQALLNCTRLSLIPKSLFHRNTMPDKTHEELKKEWRDELALLERKGHK